jgi:8-oxo-dGTP pyrophosphatase MutT (NUDIX family)
MNTNKMFEIPRQAVCVVRIREDGSILTVTRRGTDILCLPGGKVDDGESLEYSAVRECFEETGILVDIQRLLPVYSAIVSGDSDGVDYYCTAFVCNETHPFDYRSSEKWSIEEGISVQFSDIGKLLNAEYNVKVFENILKLKYF